MGRATTVASLAGDTCALETTHGRRFLLEFAWDMPGLGTARQHGKIDSFRRIQPAL